MASSYRTEKDVLGKVKVPSGAYYGSETARAVDNFRVSGMRLQEEFIVTYVMLKRCAAVANFNAMKLDKKRKDAIVKACDFILKGNMMDQFVVDVFQAGGGTSTNMNVNEVIANKAIEILGGRKGEYAIVHPNDHVNMSQSSNDTFPTAMNIASYLALDSLIKSMKELEKTLDSKRSEFMKIIKPGRTHLQDAVPIRMGEEFKGYLGEVSNAIKALELSRMLLLSLPIGGTAVGTGLNAGKKYKENMIAEIRRTFKADFRLSSNIFTGMQSRIDELSLSDSLVEAAVAIGKISNDIRFLSSGPNSGIAEILLPAVQPGSSIMPGKINPSIPEMMNMVCFQVIGNGTVVREAVSAGQLEINVFEPVMIFNILFSIKILANGTGIFARKAIAGMKADREKISTYLKMDPSIATALSPYIGYSKAAMIARKAFKEKRRVIDVCLELGVLDRKTLERILDPSRQV
jgi:aspartate ammonia-lyase